ncbi:MAG: transcriptional repressor [Candidatus Scalindua sp. AMX11]|nr:MAG: transcriptional repressor [Candidatus Scalindua sp.]NOG85947.1 transcriptional repressor [Planctomycetota bacterium]RZV91420.1 MAG: transcriptional repressor [Candidatus Scalindua sp. SCAELEC01]TDE65978.1 MAG: transcriptional repressor [Candidatus Scalindua sp. AMX11]GJQ59287.1 MAG: transcriptional repressor [Candidatus Scalindua sp.]
MKKVEELIKLFKSKDLKITPQRLGIFKVLEGNATHPSAESIYNEIRQVYPTISFTTVYKTLEVLESLGEILKITIDAGRKYFDPNTIPHHHIICSQCNMIADVNEGLEELKLPNEILDKFTPSRYDISFYGTCKQCA